MIAFVLCERFPKGDEKISFLCVQVVRENPKMKILYFSVIEQNTGWGAEGFLNNAFHEQGAETLPVDFRKHRERLASLCKDVPEFDCLFLQRGDDFPLEIIEAANCPKFFYFSELLLRRRDADHLFKANVFDRYFVRSDSCRAFLLEKGWVPESKISIHLSAFDPKLFNAIPDAKKDIDVLFVGAQTKRRKKILGDLSKDYKVVAPSVFGRDANEYFNRAKIILNIHAEDFLDTETRVFEVLGSGSFLLTEKLASENPFNAQQLVEVDSIEEMKQKIGYYLQNQKERESIALAGRSEALENHSYAKRAEELLGKFREFRSNSTALFDQVALDNYIGMKRSRTTIKFKQFLRKVRGAISGCC